MLIFLDHGEQQLFYYQMKRILPSIIPPAEFEAVPVWLVLF
jgi:hypothetical protein